MAYSEDPKAINNQFLKLCFSGLNNRLEQAKAKVCMPPNHDSADCRHFLSFQTELNTVKEKLIQDPPATLDEATARLLPYTVLIEQLLAEDTEFAYRKSFSDMRKDIAEYLPTQDTINGGRSSQ